MSQLFRRLYGVIIIVIVFIMPIDVSAQGAPARRVNASAVATNRTTSIRTAKSSVIRASAPTLTPTASSTCTDLQGQTIAAAGDVARCVMAFFANMLTAGNPAYTGINTPPPPSTACKPT